MCGSREKHRETIVLHHPVWVLLADLGRAKLLRCGLTANDRCHVETCDVIENEWPGHDHPRSSPLWKNAAESYGIEDDEMHEDMTRFVHEVIGWLERRMVSYGIGQLVVLAPPRFTGVFRKTKFAQSHPLNVIQHKGDLVNLPARKLAEHPTIRPLVAE